MLSSLPDFISIGERGGSRRIGFVTSTIMDIDIEHNQVTVTAASKETKFRYDFPYI